MNKIFRKLQNQNGFTLVETILAGAMGILIIGGFMGGIAGMSTIQKGIETSSDAMSFTTQISETLKAGDACKDSLATKSMNIADGSAIPTDISMNVKVFGSNYNLATDAEPVPGLRITSVQLVPNSNIPADDYVAADGSALKEKLALLKIGMKKQVNGVWQPMSDASIPMRLITTPSGTVKYCNSSVDVAQVCAQGGGTYEMVGGVYKCLPKNHCDMAGSYGVKTSSGYGGYANEITGGESCPVGFQAVRSGSATFAKSCGKTCVENAYAATYSCVRCGSEVGINHTTISSSGSSSLVQHLIDEEISTNSGQSTAVAALPPASNPGGNSGGGGVTPVGGGGGVTPVGGGGGGGGGCFVAGTQIILADGSRKPIEKVAVGDRLLSFNEITGQPYNSSVVETLHHPAAAQVLYDVVLQDGHRFTSNGIHPFYIGEAGSYSKMKDIYAMFKNKVRVDLTTSDAKTSAIAAIRVRKTVVPVYNLHVDGVDGSEKFDHGGTGHNYFADGVLAHNAQAVNKN